MKLRFFIASFALHAAVICSMAGFYLCHRDSDHRLERYFEVFFEATEATSPQTAEFSPSPTPQEEKSETGETAAPVPEPVEAEAANALGSEIHTAESVQEDKALQPQEEAPLKEAADAFPEASAQTGQTDAVYDEERARVVSDPIALSRITPVYPRSARRKGHEGCVVVEITVAKDGGVSSAKVASSSGHPELDAAALQAVRTAKFAPATEDGAAVSGRLRLTFDFKLEQGAQ